MTLADSPVLLGLAGSFLAGMVTAVGALPIFLMRRMGSHTEAGMLGFSAGVMLAAAFFSLLLPALSHAAQQYGGDVAAVAVVSVSVLLGAALLSTIHRYVPHEHFIAGREGPVTERLARIWLFVLAITLHNFPEGLAVGVAFAGGGVADGMPVAIGIGLQNAPEGLAVALALASEGYGTGRSFLIALLTGLVEPIGGLAGAGAIAVFHPLLPWGMALAGGAMLFVISGEIIPETHRSGHARYGTWGLMLGLVTMMCLDVVFS